MPCPKNKREGLCGKWRCFNWCQISKFSTSSCPVPLTFFFYTYIIHHGTSLIHDGKYTLRQHSEFDELRQEMCKDQSLTQQTHCKTCHIGTAASRRVWLKCLVFYSTAHVDCWVQLDLCVYVLPCMDRVLTWCFCSNHKSSFWKKALIHLKVKVSFFPTSMPALQ